MKELVTPKPISLKNHPDFTEAFIENEIKKDPSIIGLGDLVAIDKQRPQPKAGRLDLLLQDRETYKRYEVEIQLGKTDESHIIRTIEYWDIERKRYPQYEHCAVIIAEEITSRFLNVISLFNGHIPLIAIQLKAYEINENHFLTFTTVLDEISFGLVDEDEEVSEPTDRSYWEKRGTPKTVKIADEVLSIIHEYFPSYELKYNKFYIVLANDGKPDNFVVFRVKKNFTRMEIGLDKSDEIEEVIENAGLDLMDYDERNGKYRIRLTPNDVKKFKKIISKLIRLSKGIPETESIEESVG